MTTHVIILPSTDKGRGAVFAHFADTPKDCGAWMCSNTARGRWKTTTMSPMSESGSGLITSIQTSTIQGSPKGSNRGWCRWVHRSEPWSVNAHRRSVSTHGPSPHRRRPSRHPGEHMHHGASGSKNLLCIPTTTRSLSRSPRSPEGCAAPRGSGCAALRRNSPHSSSWRPGRLRTIPSERPELGLLSRAEPAALVQEPIRPALSDH